MTARDGGVIDEDDKARPSVVSFAGSQCHENDAGTSGVCMELDDTHAMIFETTFIENQAHGNSGAIVANAVTRAAIMRSTFLKSNVARKGNDLLIQDDKNTFVKCDTETFFCNGLSGIVDEGHDDNINCVAFAKAFSLSVCDAY